MGYYIDLIESNIFIDKKHFDAIYQKMCKLNDYDELKRGGAYGGNNDPVEGERYNRSKWFSWMDYNYPETCKNMLEILSQVGFDYMLDDNGNISSLGYSNKTGNEDYFLCCLAGYTRDGDYLTFNGEEPNDYYRYVFKNNKMIYERGHVDITYEEADVYEFGKMSESDVHLARLTEEFRKKYAQEKSNS